MTAVLEFRAKEDLDKLLKTAKIFGIYAKKRKINLAAQTKQIAKENERRIFGERGKKIINDIRQRVIDADETMTMDEINAEIAEYRKEKRMHA